MGKIHYTAIIDPDAELADDIVIGPFCYIEAGVKIDKGCVLESHVSIKGGSEIGEANSFGQGSVIGGDPQDKKYKGEPTFLVIGRHNIFREYVTIHRAAGEGKSTRIGDHNFLMAYVHLGHNVVVQNSVTIANNTGVSGHVTIEDFATIGGMSGIHQFCRVGKVSMIGGMTKITRDVPPFMIVDGLNEEVHDINAIGLRRQSVTPESRMALHKACKLLYKSRLGTKHAINLILQEVQLSEEVKYLLDFEARRGEGRYGRGDQR